AIEQYQQIVELAPEHPMAANAQFNYGNALALQGKSEQAELHFHEALRLKPDFAEAHLSYGTLLLQNGKLAAAIQETERACEFTAYRNRNCLDTLAAAYIQANRWDEVIQMAEKAIQSALQAGEKDLAAKFQERLAQYRKRRSAAGNRNQR